MSFQRIMRKEARQRCTSCGGFVCMCANITARKQRLAKGTNDLEESMVNLAGKPKVISGKRRLEENGEDDEEAKRLRMDDTTTSNGMKVTLRVPKTEGHGDQPESSPASALDALCNAAAKAPMASGAPLPTTTLASSSASVAGPPLSPSPTDIGSAALPKPKPIRKKETCLNAGAGSVPEMQYSSSGRPIRSTAKAQELYAYGLLDDDRETGEKPEGGGESGGCRRPRRAPPRDTDLLSSVGLRGAMPNIPYDPNWVMPKMDKWDQSFWEVRHRLLKEQLAEQGKQIERLKSRAQLLTFTLPDGTLQQGLPRMPRMYSAPTPLPRPPMEITNLTAMPVDVECKANASPSGTAPTGNSASPAGGIAPSPPRSLTQPAPAPPLPTAGPEPASAITTTSGSATVPLHAHHMASSSMTSICSSSSGANTAVPHFVTSDSSSVSASTASSVPASNSSSISTTSSSTPQTPISFPTAFPSPGSGKQDPCQVSASPAARQNSIKHKTAGSPGAVLQAASALKVNLHISPNPQAKLGQSAQSGSVDAVSSPGLAACSTTQFLHEGM
uniref:Uncharacterized protein n=2 Tax=Eutreptiella gymnastica TaxID=73025 RepID=A0A7S4FJV4_9EUGL